VSVTTIDIEDSLTEAEPGLFGPPSEGEGGFGTPSPSDDLTQFPFAAPGWDAGIRRNNLSIDSSSAVGPTGPTGPPGTPGGSATWAQVLTFGNATSQGTVSNDVIISTGDSIIGESDLRLTVAGTGEVVVDAAVTINGNVTINGTATTIDTVNLLVEDDLILLSKNAPVGGPGGIAVERGATGDDLLFLWSEANNRVEFGFFDTTVGTTTPASLLVFADLKIEDLQLSGTMIQGDGNLQVVGAGQLELATSVGSPITFTTNGVQRWCVDSNGHFTAIADNVYDIGALGATRPRTAYVGTSVVVGSTVTITSNSVSSDAGNDLFLGARGSSTALNEVGDESLLSDSTFSSTSLIGSINELRAEVASIVIGGGGESLAATLAIGNTTGGNDIVVSSGDNIVPGTHGGSDLGSAASQWNQVFIEGTLFGSTEGNSFTIQGTHATTAAQQGVTLEVFAGNGATTGNGGDVLIDAGLSPGGSPGHISIGANYASAIWVGAPIQSSANNGLGDGSGVVIGHVPAGVNEGSALQVQSYTTTQRNNLGTGIADGMLVYNTTTNALEGRINSAWVDLTSGVGGSLAATLTIGNTTGGNNILVSSGDRIQNAGGQDLTLHALAGDGVTVEADGSNVSVHLITSGEWIPGSDGVQDLGRSGDRWRTGYFSTSVDVGNLTINQSSIDTSTGLTIGGTNATSLTLGRPGLTTMVGGALGYAGANADTWSIQTSEVELVGLTGSTHAAVGVIPANALVLGVTTRVTAAIGGATSYDVGDGSDVNHWGAGITVSSGPGDFTDNTVAWNNGPAADVVLKANGGVFTSGAVRIVVTYISLTAPTS
jgi:hypothetical protein